MTNELNYEVWYKGPTGRTKKMAAFRMRFMAELLIESLSESEQKQMYIVNLNEDRADTH